MPTTITRLDDLAEKLEYEPFDEAEWIHPGQKPTRGKCSGHCCNSVPWYEKDRGESRAAYCPECMIRREIADAGGYRNGRTPSAFAEALIEVL